MKSLPRLKFIVGARQIWIAPASVALALGSLSACLFDGPTTCTSIAADQKASLMPPVDLSAPVVIQVDPRFTVEQRSALEEAVAVWNAFGGQSLQRRIFELRVSAPSDSDRPRQIDDCDFDGSDDATFRVIREDSEIQWRSLGLSARNPGVTIRCRRGNSLAKQAVLINTRFTESAQLTSIFIHELGHALGLDHSCMMGAGQADYASCQGIPESHPYHQAVMYPSLRVGSTEVETKNSLRANDRERAQCLYKED